MEGSIGKSDPHTNAPTASRPARGSKFSGGPFFWGAAFPRDSSDMGDFTPRFLGHQPPQFLCPLEESRAVSRRPRRRRLLGADVARRRSDTLGRPLGIPIDIDPRRIASAALGLGSNVGRRSDTLDRPLGIPIDRPRSSIASAALDRNQRRSMIRYFGSTLRNPHRPIPRRIRRVGSQSTSIDDPILWIDS